MQFMQCHFLDLFFDAAVRSQKEELILYYPFVSMKFRHTVEISHNRLKHLQPRTQIRTFSHVCQGGLQIVQQGDLPCIVLYSHSSHNKEKNPFLPIISLKPQI